MLFTELVLQFLHRLGYEKNALLVTSVPRSEPDETAPASVPCILSLEPNSERVMAAFLLSADREKWNLSDNAIALSDYCQQFEPEIPRYIIVLNHQASNPRDQISFYLCDDTDSVNWIDIEEFPEYRDLLLNYTLNTARIRNREDVRKQNSFKGFAYFMALLFILLAVADIYVDNILDVSYLNVQRVLLLIAAVMCLFLPRLFHRSESR